MPCIRFSSERQDIIDVNRRSVQCKSGISIVELSMMDGVMGKDIAESIRSEIIAKNVTVRQLTNLSEIYANWTQYSKEMQAIMNIRYIAKEVFDIQNEILIFDNTVAMYHVEPEVYYMEIEDPQYADMMRALFDNLWKASQMMIWGIGG